MTLTICLSLIQQPDHFQSPPQLCSPWVGDAHLRHTLQRLLPHAVYARVEKELESFGERVAGDLLDAHWDCHRNPPTLQHYDSNGRRIDKIHTSAGWKAMKTAAAEEGLVALSYEREHGEFSRLVWAAKMFMFGPSSGLFNCPLAMTDGAARLIDCSDDSFLKTEVLPRLTSRDPALFWTSGQWMTEKKGGSDVADATETTAAPMTAPELDSGRWPHMTHRLHGVKWFTSATDSDMALALARERDARGALVPGNKGLALFFVRLRGPDGRLQGIEVRRLKDKLGTRQLPTAELLLAGTPCRKISPSGRGIQTIATLVNVTRIYNSIAAIGRSLAHG
jgi:alkylation response protein AidB-like acyl-CoA dehydrogenase